MKQNFAYAASAAVVCFALAVPAGDAAAQTMKSVAGSYSAVSVPAFGGDKARGMMVLTPEGRYIIVVGSASMTKIASGSRTKATAAENKMVVDSSLGHYGKYTIDDGGKAITLHVQMATFPNWDGTAIKRALKVKGDTLAYTVTAPSTGSNVPEEVVWKRIK